jgi:hypothetical protein
MRILRYVLLVLVFIFFVGLFPREWQNQAPTVFAACAAVVILISNRILRILL